MPSRTDDCRASTRSCGGGASTERRRGSRGVAACSSRGGSGRSHPRAPPRRWCPSPARRRSRRWRTCPAPRAPGRRANGCDRWLKGTGAGGAAPAQSCRRSPRHRPPAPRPPRRRGLWPLPLPPAASRARSCQRSSRPRSGRGGRRAPPRRGSSTPVAVDASGPMAGSHRPPRACGGGCRRRSGRGRSSR